MFSLLGLQRITGTQSFPSDHWGLRVGLGLDQGQGIKLNQGQVEGQGRKRKVEED